MPVWRANQHFGFSACMDHSHLGLNFGHATFRDVDIRLVPCRPRCRASVPGIVIRLGEKFGFCRFLGHERMVPAKSLKSETGVRLQSLPEQNAKTSDAGDSQLAKETRLDALAHPVFLICSLSDRRKTNRRNVVEDQEWNARSDSQKLDWLRERLCKVEAEQVKFAEDVELEMRRLKRAARAH
ncbi:MAG TPA: hypothetical protein VKR31_05335 [Rhizomicrobium sp.]|nr:hypothetical protein [Rhizomicrobium sp.]